MKKKTLTRSDFANVLTSNFVVTKSLALEIVESILEIIALGLKDDSTAKISGFGTFSIRDKNERIARNPRTGEPAIVSKRKVVTFHLSRKLKSSLNNIEKN